MTSLRRVFLFLAVLCLAAPVYARQDDKPADKAPEKTPTIAEKVKGLQKIDGYIPLYWDAHAGKMFMEISRFNQEFLYQVSLAEGLGSNPVGLDRGQLGDTSIVRFERVGPKVLMIQPNYQYRAITSDEPERRAVHDSFAQSVLWGFKVEAEDGARVLVDATSFFMRDAHRVASRLQEAKQGTYKLDDSRSALYMPRTKGFPKNTEVEATLTFTTDGAPGRYVIDTTPTPTAVTLREHHSLVELPDGNYKPRKLDPRAPSFGIEFYDYATPLDKPVEQRWIARHRLEKKNPTAAISDPVQPIVYYVDPGAPEAIRTALVEGVSWWNQAFEAAGFRNAFQVKVLPADADPLDVRYNIIDWVHRSTRGWSYGGGITDPRTGEIIKGVVTLGSLRARQDFTIGSGLVPQYAEGGGPFACLAGLSPDEEYLAETPNDARMLALARIRQLGAHETGHTLGFGHNMAASSYGRASVMDYPAPMVDIKDGHLDLSNAYATGIGEFDKFAVKYAYSQFPSGTNEDEALETILEDGVAAGMLYVQDSDARPPGAAHPLAALWDNGSDPVASLKHEMDVRRIAMSEFGLKSIPVGTPLSDLELKLVPLYLHHRYQLLAASHSLGGVYFTYAVRTANGPNPSRVAEIVPGATQKAALDAILDTISVDALRIPERILTLLPPQASGYGGGTAEPFARHTDPAFDPISAAGIAADLALTAILQPQRDARILQQHARDASVPSLGSVVGEVYDRTWGAPRPADGYGQAIQDAVRRLTVERLMDLASNDDASAQVRAQATAGLRRIRTNAARSGTADAEQIKEDITRFLTRPDATHKRAEPPATPPGEPIGGKGGGL
jgi:hypothetical protein